MGVTVGIQRTSMSAPACTDPLGGRPCRVRFVTNQSFVFVLREAGPRCLRSSPPVAPRSSHLRAVCARCRSRPSKWRRLRCANALRNAAREPKVAFGECASDRARLRRVASDALTQCAPRSLALLNSRRTSMTLFHRLAGCLLMASLLGLAGCPVVLDHRDGRGDGRSSERGRHDGTRDDRGDSRRDDSHDKDHRSDDDHPR